MMESEIAIAIGLAVYARMARLAHDNNQVIGENQLYYVTLEQLERAFITVRDEGLRADFKKAGVL